MVHENFAKVTFFFANDYDMASMCMREIYCIRMCWPHSLLTLTILPLNKVYGRVRESSHGCVSDPTCSDLDSKICRL